VKNPKAKQKSPDMNVSLKKSFEMVTVFMLLFCSSGLWGQPNNPYESATVVTGTTYNRFYYSAAVSTITNAPAHALSYGLNTTAGNITFHYKPKSTFLGKDYVTIEYYPVYPGPPSYISIQLVVVKSVVTTGFDYVTTNANQEITIAVLSNDSSSVGGLSLSATIPSVTNGTATKSGSQIHFVPDVDYEGPATVTYVACDNQNVCKTGIAYINVLPLQFDQYDTLRYTLPKNTSIETNLGLGGYSGVSKTPSKGSFTDILTDRIKYTANTNATGFDTLQVFKTINSVNYYKTVVYNLLSTVSGNKYAMDDFAATPRNTAVTFNIQTNDFGNYIIFQPGSMTSPNGTIQYLGNGNVKFTPKNNFTGTATFNYKIGYPGYSVLEIGKVSVEVSNQAPASAIFNMKTPEVTPLVIRYNNPLSNWSLTIDDQPDNGTLVLYPGQQTITIGSQQISGYNLAIYTPSNGFVNNTDEMSLKYCVPNGACTIFKIDVLVTPVGTSTTEYCQNDCVWPGDTDGDGVVSVKDMLPVAACIGVPGVERSNPNTDWDAQYGENWSNPYEPSPADLKHIDTDGDGWITQNDTAAIFKSYGQIHGIPNTFYSKIENARIVFVPRDTAITPGDDAIFDVYFGTPLNPVYDGTGFTFKFNYLNHPLITPDKVHVQFDKDNWLVKNSGSLTMSKIPTNGILHTAYSKTYGGGITGQGPVGVIIVEDIEGIKSDNGEFLSFKVEEIDYLNAQGEYIRVPDQELKIRIAKGVEKPTNVSPSDFVLFPNPNNGIFRVSSRAGIQIQSLEIYNIYGQMVDQSFSNEANINQLMNGFYFVKVISNAGSVTLKIDKTQ